MQKEQKEKCQVRSAANRNRTGKKPIFGRCASTHQGQDGYPAASLRGRCTRSYISHPSAHAAARAYSRSTKEKAETAEIHRINECIESISKIS